MIRNFWKLVSRILASILRMFLGIWRDIVGTWSWTLPGWLNFVVQCATSARTRLNRLRADSPKKLYSVMAATLGSLVLGYFAYDYYAKLPKPDLVEVTGNTPTPLGFYEGATPDSLRIQFSKSSAPLDKVGKDVSSLIVMKPTLRGKWLWESDTKLVFSPTEPWPVATDFSVALPSKNFPNHVKLDRSSYDFKTPSFEVKNIATEFYQDPQDPKIKRVILNIYFTHPVEPQGLEDKINLTLGEADNSVISSLMTKSFKFKVTYDKYFSVATVQTDPIPIPTEESVMSYTIGPLKAKGGGESNGDKTGSIKIPGMYSYFRVENADVAYTENEKFETEQILNFALSTEVEAAVFAKKLDVYVLPKDLPEVGAKKVSKNHLWRDAEVGPEILKLSKPLSVVALPTERDSAKLVSFKVGLEPGQCVFVKVSKGLHSFAGYELASDFTKVIKVQDFPERVSIMSHGALLSISGERKVSVATRDVHAVRFKMDRVVPGQLHHFISQTSGRFENASFLSSSFSSENISEVFTDVRSFPKSKKGTTQYSAVDFSEHVKGGRHGLFVFTAEGWDQKRKRRKGPSDQRVILVTDMGMLVKENQDLSLTLFLQSIRDGKPLVGVKVDVLGKNGLSVYSGTVSDQGTLTIPKVTGFRQEKSVVAIVATKGDDIAFLPLNRSDRYLNFSRFDVGGAYLTGDARKMEAYLFSERGIYRPGDLFNIGAIIKSPTWNQAEIQGAPLEYVIRDSRGMEIHKVKFQVNQDGFHEFSYKTEENSPTGTYEIGIHLIKENNRGALIGSTTIKVEEFLPDRLRIATSLSSESAKGWVKLADITGRVALHNLFGTPAQERRVKASFSLVPAAPTFKGWADYQFIDPNKTKSAASEILPELSTNSKGEAEFALPLSKFDRGLYRLTFTAEGYEASGGRGVLSLTKTLVSSLDTMVGVKPDGKLDYVRKDTDRSIHIVAVDGGLNKVAQKGLKANLIEFKYVSVLMRGSNGLYKYESVKKEISLPAQDLNIPPEGFQFKLATNQVGQFALVIKNDKDLELNRVLYSVVGEGDIGKRLDKNSELQIVLSKPDYEAGEDVELQITAPYKGAGIITIEREKVYAVKWFKTDTTNTVQRITVPKGIEGNAYVNVSFIRAQDSKEVFMSPLSYAVMPFTVSRAARTTRVEIVAPELIEPGRPLAISYRTNRPAKIAIYGVDEGILQVAKYVTPAPLDFFLRKRALQVTTFQILDLIMPEFSVLKAASSPGGGEDGLLGANLNPFKRKTMKPIVFWSGIIDATDQAREFRYDVPDYFNGSIKIMAVAVGNGTIGVAEQKTLVRGPFVISPNAPTFVAPGDEFFVSAGVSNNIEGSDEKEIEVSMSSTANLSSIEGKPQILKLAKGREGSALFKVKALDQLGDGTVTFKALSGGKSSLMAVSMSIRPPVVHHSLSQGGLGQGGDLKV
ncbi:MAG: MG2 domain-containing protein, partial [Proteobacteria bacterium]|nr:MG2 domain-containing protein [Pseudomonadota bacterium]